MRVVCFLLTFFGMDRKKINTLTPKELRHKIETGEKMIPRFDVIKKYYQDTIEMRFFTHYYYFEPYIKNAIPFINEKAKGFRNDIVYFFVECGQSLEFALWAEDVGLARENNKAIKQTAQLRKFLSSIITPSAYGRSPHKNVIKLPAIKRIQFYTDKNKEIKIDSYQLCFDILRLIEDHYLTLEERLNGFNETKINGSKNHNKRQHLKNFVLGLQPFVDYLYTEKGQFKSKNDIYNFIADLLSYLPRNLNLSGNQIKDYLKPGKNTPRK